jgi:hypothetical protein
MPANQVIVLNDDSLDGPYRAVTSGANRAAMGSTLLRSPGNNSPVQ